MQGADYWPSGKRLLMDPTFHDRLSTFDLEKELGEASTLEEESPKLRLLREDLLLHPDWDSFQAGKVFPPAEVLCKWMAASEKYYTKRRV